MDNISNNLFYFQTYLVVQLVRMPIFKSKVLGSNLNECNLSCNYFSSTIFIKTNAIGRIQTYLLFFRLWKSWPSRHLMNFDVKCNTMFSASRFSKFNCLNAPTKLAPILTKWNDSNFSECSHLIFNILFRSIVNGRPCSIKILDLLLVFKLCIMW